MTNNMNSLKNEGELGKKEFIDDLLVIIEILLF